MNGNDNGSLPKSSAKKKRIEFMVDQFNDQHRPSIISNYSMNSVISASEVTEDSLTAWKALPEEIRLDPSLISFRIKHENLIGNNEIVVK
jgi:hypothetical protein